MKFLLGLIIGILIAPLIGMAILNWGGFPAGADNKPMAMERYLAHLGLSASMRGASKIQSPLPASEANIEQGAKVYSMNCADCHGLPKQPPTPMAQGMNPGPPQFFKFPQRGPAEDPVGDTYWMVQHGVRMTGMPSYANGLTQDQRWQVTLFLKNKAHLSPAAQQILAGNPPSK